MAKEALGGRNQRMAMEVVAKETMGGQGAPTGTQGSFLGPGTFFFARGPILGSGANFWVILDKFTQFWFILNYSVRLRRFPVDPK